jgi:hypothetical protein
MENVDPPPPLKAKVEFCTAMAGPEVVPPSWIKVPPGSVNDPGVALLSTAMDPPAAFSNEVLEVKEAPGPTVTGPELVRVT